MDVGQVIIGDIDARINTGIGYLRQVQNVFTNLTVQENLETSLLPLKLDKQKAIDAILQDSPMLKGKLDKRAGLLSGGKDRPWRLQWC